MYIIAVIPARGGSKRIPKKNIVNLAGRPLIAYTIEHARKSRLINRIIVSTDDGEIADIARAYGVEVVRRPKELSDDSASSESAILHVLDFLEASEKSKPDMVVFLQCTSPLRKDDDIDNAINKLINDGADSLFSACRFKKYIWETKDGAPTPINYDYRVRWREQDFPAQFQENGSIYISKRWVLRELKNRLGGRITVYEMGGWHSLQVDTNEDLELCEFILRKKMMEGTIDHDTL